MKRRLLIFVTMFVTIGISTVWSQESNYLQIDDMQAEQGGQAVLSVLLSNVDEVCAYSFELTLPEGVTIAKNENDKFKVDIGARADDHTISTNLEGGTYYLACLSLTSTPFSGNSGSVCNITLSIDESIDLGERTIEIRNIELVNPNNTIYHPDNISSTLSVVVPAPKYAEGYKVWIEPFTLTEDREDIEILLDNINELKSVEFDLLLPIEFINKEAYSVTLGTSTSGTKKYTANIYANEDGSLHLSCVIKGTNVIPILHAGCILQLGLWFSDEDEHPIVDSGVYEYTIKNIVVTDLEDNEYEVVPISGYFKVGTEAKGDINLTGNLTSVDLTDMEVDETTNVILSNPNTIIYIVDGKKIKNKNNVVIGTTCANLVLTDGYAFCAPKEFTAAKASYTRAATNGLGTLCLPFAAKSVVGSLYELTSAESNKLTFTPVKEVKGNTPYLYRSESAVIEETNAMVEAEAECEIVKGDWTMTGAYSVNVFSGEDNVFALYDGKLYKNSKHSYNYTL